MQATQPDSVPLLILASKSPRRAKLLADAGLPFTQLDPPFNDPPQPDHGDPVAVTTALARRKAHSLASHPNALILAADTTVVAPDNILLGQPHDRADAARMLNLLIDRTHLVITSICLYRAAPPADLTLSDTATVHIGPVAPAQLTAYLNTGAWQGKAGAYNLPEVESRWPIRIDGDPATVVGLPMRKLLPALHPFGIHPNPRNPARNP